MQITLTFDSLEDAQPHIDGPKYEGNITDALHYIRGILKYSDCSKETTEHLERIRSILTEV